MLGTVVMIHLEACEDMHAGECSRWLHQAAEAAFGAIADIERAMSAHRPESDLGRIARAAPGSTVAVDPHTTVVLKLAQHWHSLSRGAFDPCAAGARLAMLNRRPAFHEVAGARGSLRDLQTLSSTEVRLERPLQIDLGGIAKGYAVDLAIETLRRWGVESALVNAGGDMRSLGRRAWPVEVRGQVGFRGSVPRALRHVCDGAIASSEAAGPVGEFVRTVRRAPRWASCTVMARDCVTADALTKWGLQSAETSPTLRRVLRTYRAKLWKS
jgi:thiamine biosynthesis lipoprotein